MRELKIPAIKNGTVIDHIPSRVTFKVMRMLQLKDYEHTITVDINLESKKINKKGIIKISDRFLTKNEVSKVTLLAPEASVSIIRDFEIDKKIRLKIPEVITDIVNCTNPKCITNIEPVSTKFHLVQTKPLKIRCRYCERLMDDIKLT
jgi:aspartate carbamoyltransferase regulatory subunit